MRYQKDSLGYKALVGLFVTVCILALPVVIIFGKKKYEIVNTIQVQEVLGYVEDMRVTCYSLVEFSSNGKTASGKWVEEGMVASNKLPFGTQLKIEGYGDQIFTVEDRFMTGWTAADLDIYFGADLDAYRKCLEFGKQNLEVLILQERDSIFN